MNPQDDAEIPAVIKITRLQFQTIPEMTREVIDTCQQREYGFRKKTVTVPPTLQATAEDRLVKKDYKEMKCHIPELTKSTFLMVFSPDGTKMASTHGNHNVYVTDLRTGKHIKTLVGHPRTPWCVAFHPSSNQILASGCLGGQVRIWDLSGGSEMWATESQTAIASLAFHPVDRLLVIATYNELYFWDWSKPKPFMQTCTNNAKEKVRYVAFDRLGHKLITGIANSTQGVARWERVRAPVPVSRHFERIATFRRRITPRLVPPSNMPPVQPTNTSPPDSNLNNIPERERRIAVYYRNLMEQYEMLVHHCLEVYRPTTTMDRGTDPMEIDPLPFPPNRSAANADGSSQTSSNINASTSASASANDNIALNLTTTSSSADSSITTSGPVTISTQTLTQSARTSPLSLPGPSGLSRQSISRPGKRTNTNLGAKSDSSTVYQSDSSSSSSSDESPTPKRRISLVPNVGVFRKDSGSTSKASSSNVPGDKFDKKKRLFMSRPSAFHPARIFTNINNPHVHRRLLERPTRHPGLPDTAGLHPSTRRTADIPNPRVSPDRPSRANRDAEDLPSPLSRLRGISEGSLSSADEVINFSERPIPNREEPSDPYIPEPTVEPEIPEQTGVLDNIYSNILSDLETSLNNVRNNRPHHNRNGETTSMLLSFSQRLENIMNQSDAILANLRRSMEMLMEPSQLHNQQSQPHTSSTTDSSNARRIFILGKLSGIHARNRQGSSRAAGNTSRANPQNAPGTSHFPRYSSHARGLRYPRNRTTRFNNRMPINNVWRPFDDHNYPRDPEQGTSGHRFSNLEPIRNLLTLSPRSPSGERPPPPTEDLSLVPPLEEISRPVRTSTPAPLPSAEHNYPLAPTESPDNPTINLENPIADHTYPRDPQSSTSGTNPRDCIAPLISSLHSTISHISIQTNLLRRQVESIELIDRARFEVFQLQELRRMWEEVRRHLNFVSNSSSDRRSNMSNVRQMMAWTRISDPTPTPSSESPQSSTEQSTTESSPSTDRPSTSRTYPSNSNDSRSAFVTRVRHNIKKRIQNRFFWRRRQMRNESPFVAARRYLRGHMFRHCAPRPTRYSEAVPQTSNQHTNLSEVTVSLMMRGLEYLLIQQSRLFGRQDSQNPANRNDIEHRVLSERVIHSRLRAARARLTRVHGLASTPAGPLDESIEFSSLRNHTDWVRYEARLRLSVYIETLTGFIEDHSNNIPQVLNDQIMSLLELALLLTDLLLLQIMDSIPASPGSILDPERESLAVRIDQMCSHLLTNQPNIRSASLTRVLHSLRLTSRYMVSMLRLNRHQNERTSRFGVNYRNYHREAMLELDLQLGNLLQFTNYLNDTPPSPPPEPQNLSASSVNNMAPVYRLGDLLNHLRSMRGRLELISQNPTPEAQAPPTTSSAEPAVPAEPARSTDESPSERDSESYEGANPWLRVHGSVERGALYRTQHMNLYPPDQSSSQSSPERANHPMHSRSWNVPTVQVNSVPVSEGNSTAGYHPRTWTQRYISEIRPLSAATGLFRPRFLIPFYAGVHPLEADLDDPPREPPVSYEGFMTNPASPNHRIQMWDISKCCIPNISNHEKNIVVSECKIQSDGSVDISRDGTLLVTLLPSGGYLNVTNRLGIYSIKWATLGQCLYTTSFEQNAISVSLSPLSRHLIVGLASRRVTLLPTDRWTMARIFFLDDKKIKITGRGRLVMLRDLEQRRDRDLNFISVNCIKWMPISGQGIVYATNTGQLKVLT